MKHKGQASPRVWGTGRWQHASLTGQRHVCKAGSTHAGKRRACPCTQPLTVVNRQRGGGDGKATGAYGADHVEHAQVVDGWELRGRGRRHGSGCTEGRQGQRGIGAGNASLQQAQSADCRRLASPCVEPPACNASRWSKQLETLDDGSMTAVRSHRGQPAPLPLPTWLSTSWMQPKMIMNCWSVMVESGLNE